MDITHILTVCRAVQRRPGGTDSPGTAEWLTCPGLIQALVVCLLLHQPASPTLRPILHAWPRPRRLCVCYKTTAGSCYCQDSNVHQKDLSDSNPALWVRDRRRAGFLFVLLVNMWAVLSYSYTWMSFIYYSTTVPNLLKPGTWRFSCQFFCIVPVQINKYISYSVNIM